MLKLNIYYSFQKQLRRGVLSKWCSEFYREHLWPAASVLLNIGTPTDKSTHKKIKYKNENGLRTSANVHGKIKQLSLEVYLE